VKPTGEEFEPKGSGRSLAIPLSMAILEYALPGWRFTAFG
jgi:hypothetical protein